MTTAAEVRDDVLRRIGVLIAKCQICCRVGLMEPADLTIRIAMVSAVGVEAAAGGWVECWGARYAAIRYLEGRPRTFGARTVALIARVDGAIHVGIQRRDQGLFYAHPLVSWPGFGRLLDFEEYDDRWTAWASVSSVVRLDDMEVDAILSIPRD